MTERRMSGSGAGGAALKTHGLTKHFGGETHWLGLVETPRVRAVEQVSFELRAGETLALVGESGCGKSTTARLVLKLLAASGGRIELAGEEITALPRERELWLRKTLQIVFQDPYGSLNPRMLVRDILAEPLLRHAVVPRGEVAREVRRLLELVGLTAQHAERYPHEFSGGQRQRICIARALAPRPKVIVCDEAVSALDVSVQAQIINLLQDLQQELGMSYLFIAHDLSVVRHIADRVAVMYLGRIVELGPNEEIFARPAHPYTQALLQAVPLPDPRARGGITPLRGEIPSPLSPPSGCHFHPRCPLAEAQCRSRVPELQPLPLPAEQAGDHGADGGNTEAAGRLVACHRWERALADGGAGSRLDRGGGASEQVRRLAAFFAPDD